MVRGFQGAGASCLAPSRAYPATEVNRVPSPIMKLNNATMRTSHTPYLLTRTGSGTWDLHKSPPEHKVGQSLPSIARGSRLFPFLSRLYLPTGPNARYNNAPSGGVMHRRFLVRAAIRSVVIMCALPAVRDRVVPLHLPTLSGLRLEHGADAGEPTTTYSSTACSFVTTISRGANSWFSG